MEGWLLVSCSCSSSSAKEVTKELSAEEDVGLLQEEEEGEGWRKELSGLQQPTGSDLPVRVQVERPQQAGRRQRRGGGARTQGSCFKGSGMIEG